MIEPELDANPPLQVQAPGKLVLWGEYAVLAGAQAGVLAVNRFARCELTPQATSQAGKAGSTRALWQITTQGFDSNPITLDAAWFASRQPPAANHPGVLLWHAAAANRWQPSESATLHIDSSAFYQATPSGLGKDKQPPVFKLGLGSSAAVCTALTHLCAELGGNSGEQSTSLHRLTKALIAHRAAQDGAGSGIDVAASSLGGLLSYQLNPADVGSLPKTKPIAWPKALHWRAFWTGTPASTPDHLKRFDAWRAQGDTVALTRLVEASQICSDQLDLTTLANYVAALRRFDAASQVGIYSKGHANLHKLAERIGVIYKPCGAGGGDLGVAFAEDSAQLSKFASAAAADDIVQIDLEMAKHGVTTQAGNHQPNP